MITPAEITKKARRKYHDVLRAYLSRELYFPLTFPVGKPAKNLVERRKAIQTLRDNASQIGEAGYKIEWKTVNKRDLGEQTIPTHIVFSSIDDYLAVVRKKTEFDVFKTNVAKIRAKFPQLEDWMYQYPHHIIEYQDVWDDLLAVCRYFTLHSRPNVYIRELPIAVHTKFIEKHTSILRNLLDIVLPKSTVNGDASDFIERFGLIDKPSLVRMRLLDEQLDWQYTIKIDDISLPVDQLEHLLNKHIQPRHIIVVENLINFLTVPSHPGTVALFGGGFGVHILKDVAWLEQCDVLYWGDIDAHGFQILSDFRSIFSHVRSVLMDKDTLDENIQFTVPDNQNRATRFVNLLENEQELLDYIWEYQLRLEQEHIPNQYAVDNIKKALLVKS